MRIGYYIHHSMLKAGGIYTYSIGILRLLLKAAEIKSVVIFTTSEVKSNLREFESNSKIEFKILDRDLFFNKLRFALSYFLFDIYTIYKHHTPDNKYLNLIKRISISTNPYNSVISKANISLFQVPMQYSPIYGTKTPIVITMHDLQEFHIPENFSSGERIHRSINNHKAIYNSDKIIVSFNHIKNDVKKYFKVDESKVSVCPPPFAENWFSTSQETEWYILEKKYGIKKKYLLYPAATWPHKNHLRLLESLREVKRNIADITLICTGNKTEYYSTIKERINELNLQDSVKFLGIVPEEDLIGLYKNTELVVIPTLYEAGSGPLYEAMKYNVPVICAKTTSLPETISDKRFTFDPNKSEEIVNLIKRIITSEELRNYNVHNSKKRMMELSDFDYYNSFGETYKSVISKY